MMCWITGARALGIVPIVLFLSSTDAAAQQMEFAQAQKANQAALRQYTWKSRTELRLNGESKNVRLEQVRYGFDGQLQKTQIGGAGDSDAGRGERGRAGGPIRQRVIARKKEEFQELMNDLAMLAGSYAHLSPSQLQTFGKQATFSKGRSGEGGSIRIQGRDVVVAGDEMVVWVDPLSYTIRRVEIRTTLEAAPVHVVADYRSLDNGLSYQARSILRYPEKHMELTVENFDYQFAGRSR